MERASNLKKKNSIVFSLLIRCSVFFQNNVFCSNTFILMILINFFVLLLINQALSSTPYKSQHDPSGQSLIFFELINTDFTNVNLFCVFQPLQKFAKQIISQPKYIQQSSAEHFIKTDEIELSKTQGALNIRPSCVDYDTGSH